MGIYPAYRFCKSGYADYSRIMFVPKYTITDGIVSRLSEIAEIKAMVERSSLVPAREAFLRRAAVIKMGATSTSIEGNRLQEYQVKKVAEGEKGGAPAE